MIFCSKCGTSNPQGSHFCRACGLLVSGGNAFSSGNYFGQQAPQLPTGVIATRSGAVKYQVVLNAIIFPFSLLLTVITFLSVQIELFLFFLFFDFVSFALPGYFLIQLIRIPKDRIISDGGSLTFRLTRDKSVTLNPCDIINVSHKRLSWFLVGWFFTRDGKLIINSNQGQYVMRFVKNVEAVEGMLIEMQRQGNNNVYSGL